jgi:CMP-N-acetylneuraminic acid synthetase/GT2 family glycosyltransferase
MKNIVSIIITAHNYGKYLSQAIESTLCQNFEEYEVIVVNDGSTDNTLDILKKYNSNPRIRIFHLNGIGLAAASNYGIRMSQGQYVIRLDADDYFDENILLVESRILDKHPEIGMVYPDYFLVDKYGNIMEHVRLQKINDEVKLLDRNPLAAGAMYRRTCYDSIGGYNEALRYQEDYDFWIRFIEKFNVYNVNLPLMYYRKHDKSMSNNLFPRMATRRRVKNSFAQSKEKQPLVLAVIPTRSDDWNGKALALKELCGKPVISYSIEEALKTKGLSRVVVSTDCVEIADLAQKLGAEVPFLRPKSLCMNNVPLEEVIRHAVTSLREADDFLPDIVLTLQITSPFRKSSHIQEVIDTMVIHDVDSVVSVYKDISFHWKPSLRGLTPVIYKKRLLRKDKDTVYRENGALYGYKAQNILRGRGLGKVVGHIEMLREESIRLNNEFDLWIAEQMIMQKKVFH